MRKNHTWKITATFTSGGKLVFTNQHGKVLLSEFARNLKDGSSEDLSALKIDGREFNPEKGDIYKITARFDACDDEKIFGMVAVRYCRYFIGFYSCVCKR